MSVGEPGALAGPMAIASATSPRYKVPMLDIGQEVERYVVEAELGTGGMAVVYRVRHRTLGTVHALKVLTLRNPMLRERLVQEGRIQARLRHPNVVQVTDVLDIRGAPGLLMEFVEGPSLYSHSFGRALPIAEAERLFRGVLEAIHFAHGSSPPLVHRDLKPANVLLEPRADGYWPKVTDFGIAKVVAEVDDRMKTRSRSSMGTPSYMAPEQIHDASRVDRRADIFSLGCLLYELVTGRMAFDADAELFTILSAVSKGEYVPPRKFVPDLPDHIERAIRGALVADRELRIADCATFRAILNGERSTWTGTMVPVGPPQVTFAFDSTEAARAAGGPTSHHGTLTPVVATLPRGAATMTPSEPPPGLPRPAAIRQDAPVSPPSDPLVSRPGLGGALPVIGVAALTAVVAVGVWAILLREEGGVSAAQLAGETTPATIGAGAADPTGSLPASPGAAGTPGAATPAGPGDPTAAVTPPVTPEGADTTTPAPAADTPAPDAPAATKHPAGSTKKASKSLDPPAGLAPAVSPPVVSPPADAQVAKVPLRIGANPASDVSVDGSPVGGGTPTSVSVSVGRHTVLLRSPSGKTKSVSLDVGSGGSKYCWDFEVEGPC